MDPLHDYRHAIKEGLALIRSAVARARRDYPDEIDHRQGALLLTKAEDVEDRARRMLGEPKKLPTG